MVNCLENVLDSIRPPDESTHVQTAVMRYCQVPAYNVKIEEKFKPIGARYGPLTGRKNHPVPGPA